jgi:HK97 family phage prohead protease
MEKLTKSVQQSIKDIDSKNRTIVAYASVFGNIDSDDDIIQKGAYLKTIAENGPRGKNRVWHLFNHWQDWPIAKPHELSEDNKGLLFASKMPDTDKANDLLKLYEAGFLTEHSVWIRIIKAINETQQGNDIRIIQEVALMEVSSVLWAANEAAQTVGIKSIKELNERIEAGSHMMRTGTLTDEGFKRLEQELKDIKALLSKQPPVAGIKPEETSSSTLEALIEFKNNLKTLK